jgi:8-oxo-dGTP pyrophosphatase MutT (NUDIX family)
MTDSAEPPARCGVVAVIPRGGQLLVIRRSQHVVAPGAFCFPGGGIEAGESEPAALIRELNEELGAVVRPRDRLWHSVTPWNVTLAWWLATWNPGEPLMPNPAEVESVHWLSPAEMLELPGLLTSNREFLERVLSGAIQLPAD